LQRFTGRPSRPSAMPHPKKERRNTIANASLGSWIQTRWQEATLALSAPDKLPWLAQPKEAYLPPPKKSSTQEASKVVHKERRNSLAMAIRSRGGAPEPPKVEDTQKSVGKPKPVPSLALDLLPGKSSKSSARGAKPRGEGKCQAIPATPPRDPASSSEMLSFSPLGPESWTTTGAAIVGGFAQMDEFLRRGFSVASPARSESAVAEAPLQKRLDDWAAEVGFARPRVTCEPREVPRASEESPQLMEVKLLLHGVEVCVQMSASANRIAIVDGATTVCRWAFIARGVSEAAMQAKGEALEVFLDHLLEAWELSTRKASPGAPQDLSESEEEDNEDVEEEEYADEEEENTAVRSFEDWLFERPPLFRFDQAAKGLAWDFPPSRSEKKELLLLQLFAEEGERHEEIAALKAKIPESPARGISRTSSGRVR